MIEFIPDDFLLRAAIVGFGLALIAGPLGSFIVWRRMAYFGDTLAHSALLGVAAGLFLGINVTAGVIATCVGIAMLLLLLRRQRRLAEDTLLGILSHSALSIGLVTLAFFETVRIDLLGYLFGDVLAASPADILWVYGGGALVLTLLTVLWRPMLSITVHEEMARVEGIPVALVQVVFMVLMAVVIAIGMKIVGILLITSLLIIPAATARRLARTPEQMAAGAAGIGCIAVGGGLYGSYWWDLPSGPAIVMAAAILFSLSMLLPARG